MTVYKTHNTRTPTGVLWDRQRQVGGVEAGAGGLFIQASDGFIVKILGPLWAFANAENAQPAELR